MEYTNMLLMNMKGFHQKGSLHAQQQQVCHDFSIFCNSLHATKIVDYINSCNTYKKELFND